MSGEMDDPFVTAGEYVLGTLDGAERLDASARQSRDAAFDEAVMFWEDRLSPLARLVPPVAPPSILWARLALATGVRDAPAANDNSSRFWKGSTGVAVLVAAGLAAFAFLPVVRNQPQVGAHYAAALAPLNATVPFMAEAGADGRVVVTWSPGTTPPPGHSYELWELAAGATRPSSLGVLQPGHAMALPSGGNAVGQAKLLVSEEPAGGSPTGQPTGPVVFGGTLTQVSPPDR